MNKSKFLRKSLALLLSVLMVVAMIPVGASAADKTTDLAAIKVNDSTVSVNNKTFATEVSRNSVTIKVEGLQSGETATLYKADETPVAMTVSSNTATETITLGTDWTSNGSVYSIPLKLAKGNAYDTYTVQLTKVAQKNTVELKSVTGTINTNYSFVSCTLQGNVIKLEVPYGYQASNGVLTLTTKDNAYVGTQNNTGVYTVSNVADKQAIVVTSEDSTRNTTYTVSITAVNPLTSMTIGGVAATVENKNDDVTDPYTATGSEDGKISAEYAAGQLTKDKVTGKAPAEEYVVNFTTRADTTVVYDASNANKTWANGKTYSFVDNNAWVSNKQITVTCKGIAQVYNLALSTVKNTATTIAAATVDGETAVVSGKKITANLTSGTTTATVKLTAPADATITGFTASGTADADGNDVFTNDTDYQVTDLLKGVIITVVAEDTTTRTQYELKVTATGVIDDAYLTSFALRIGAAQTQYDGVVNETAKTVTVTVPYLTTDALLQGATVVATTNAYAKVASDTTGTTFSISSAASFALSGKTGTYTQAVYAVSKKTPADVNTKYTLIVKLENAQSGMTLTNLNATSADKYNALTSDNTWGATIKTTSTTANTGTVTVKPTYSDAKDNSKHLNVKDFNTNNGGVAYVQTASSYEKLSSYMLDSTYQYNTVTKNLATNCSTDTTTGKATIVVMNEVAARAYDNAQTSPTAGTYYTYTVYTDAQAARTGAYLTSMKFGDTTIGSSLSGTVAYSVTAAASTDPADTYGVFADFTVAPGAKLIVNYTDTTAKTFTLTAKGDVDGNGEADAIDDNNAKFLLVRDTSKKTVTPYIVGKSGTAYEVDSLTVESEAGSGYSNTYTFNTINYTAANTEAKITAFSVAGSAGSIKAEGDTNWTITVNAPLGTDLTSLVPTFTASAGATVRYGSSTVKTGVTALDFSNSVVLKVTSEDGGKSSTYTVKVTASTSFSDVKTTDWFYNNVMAAYKAGYVSGRTDGTFAPSEKVSRRDFAIMVYKMMGSKDVTSTASFVDVAADDYAATAIAFLKENDIVSGYEDGTFHPAATITRQEVASILAKALNLSGTSANTFKDDAKIATWAKPAVYACYAAGVFNGDNNGNFNAQANITRAEAATAVLQAAGK